MIPVSKYQLYPNGELCLYYPLDCVYRPTPMAFFDDGTCQEFYACNPVACKEIVPDDETIYPEYFCYCHNDYTWEYNPATKSLLTQNIYYKNSSAKIMYYDSVTHKLIIKVTYVHTMTPLLTCWQYATQIPIQIFAIHTLPNIICHIWII